MSEERLPVKRLDPKKCQDSSGHPTSQRIPKSDTVGHPTSKQNKCIQMCHAGNLWQLAWREDAMLAGIVFLKRFILSSSVLGDPNGVMILREEDNSCKSVKLFTMFALT